MKNISSLLLVLAIAALTACGAARTVSRTQYGGVIALEGDRAKAMEDAHRQMSSHCGPGNYDVISEGEAVVGSETVQDQATAVRDDRRGGATARSQTVTSTSDKVEWRVEYACRGAGAPAPAPAAAYPPPPPPAPNAAPY
ncbi:MAG: hypothetical protein IPL79_07320 [Myxococcales bacterium]|nr:hypothetical protein [Myxococcales bacterium]